MSRLKFSLGAIMAVFSVVIVLGLASGSEAGEARRVVVEIRDFEFHPAKPFVAVGDIIVWKNRDIAPHTVTSAGGDWDSGDIEAGGEWETAVTETMTVDYFCAYHPAMTAILEIGRG